MCARERERERANEPLGAAVHFSSGGSSSASSYHRGVRSRSGSGGAAAGTPGGGRRRGSGRSSPRQVAAAAPLRPVSPSVIVSERKAASERAALMNPPAPSPKKAHRDQRPPSPGMMRTSAQNPPAPIKVCMYVFMGSSLYGKLTEVAGVL